MVLKNHFANIARTGLQRGGKPLPVRFLIVLAIIVVGYLSLLTIKNLSVRMATEKFGDQNLGNFSLNSDSWKDCTGCRDFQPVLDRFRSKNGRLLSMLNISNMNSEDGLNTKPVEKGPPSEPYVSIVDDADIENPVVFQGPYTEAGLKMFLSQFIYYRFFDVVPPHERVIVYRALLTGCTGCRSFEPIWDAFVAKNAATFAKLHIKVEKAPPYTADEQKKRDAILESSEYPDVALVDLDTPMEPLVFKGPYTYEGLQMFVAKGLTIKADSMV